MRRDVLRSTAGVASVVALVCLTGLHLASAQGAKPRPQPQAAAAAPKAAPPRVEQRVPFQAGESLTYDVSWSSYLVAGTATLTVREKRPSYDSVAYYIVAEARPGAILSKLYTLYYKLDVLLDAYTLLPQRASTYSEEGQRHRLKVTNFNNTARKAVYEPQAGGTTKQEIALPAYAQDALSAIYVLRAIPLKAGEQMTMPVNSGGRNYRIAITNEALETVKTGAGTFPAWRLRPQVLDDRGQADTRAIRLWLADNPSRTPVRLQVSLAVGSFNLTLREARPGGSASR
jgi:hypothetical protein